MTTHTFSLQHTLVEACRVQKLHSCYISQSLAYDDVQSLECSRQILIVEGKQVTAPNVHDLAVAEDLDTQHRAARTK